MNVMKQYQIKFLIDNLEYALYPEYHNLRFQISI